MGHMRLGKLPASRRWVEVVALLDAVGGPSIPDIAATVERAADCALRSAINDPGFVEALWLLINVPKAARTGDFQAAMEELGIIVGSNALMSAVLAAIDRHLERRRHSTYRTTTDFSILARSALLSALHGLWREELPRLWTPTLEDERTTLATFATTHSFGALAQRFFTELLGRHLHYFIDRRLEHPVISGSLIPTAGDMHDFDEALRRHCSETTLIMRTYARDWLGNKEHHLQKDLTRDDVRHFAAYALEKVSRELQVRSATP